MRGLILLAVVLALAAPGANATSEGIGFSLIQVPDRDGAPLPVGVWYPANSTGTPHALDLFTQSVATDAPIGYGKHPLIVISHGTGGSLASHFDTALALAHAGFIVAAVTHSGDNYRDASRATDLPARPRQVEEVIDAMLNRWRDRTAIDPAAIGLFGFSAGGFTVLVLAGGVPDLSRIGPYCMTHGSTFVCDLVRRHPARQPPAATLWVHDERIRAVVVAAPALGFAFAPASLSGIRVPVQLWQAQEDQILPAPDYAEPILAALRQDGPVGPTEYHLVPGADHWDFLAPCSQALASAVPSICGERGGFLRSRFHSEFNAAVVGFFQRSLHSGP